MKRNNVVILWLIGTAAAAILNSGELALLFGVCAFAALLFSRDDNPLI